MQRFLSGLQFKIESIVRHLQYADMNELLHHAREVEAQLAEEGKLAARNSARRSFPSRASPSTPPPAQTTSIHSAPSTKPE